MEEQKHSADIFNVLMNYPIPREAQRYPKPSNPELLGYNTFQSPSQIHDIITVNLTSLVPNIHIGYQMSIPGDDLIEWIKKTQEYANNLNKEFQEKCEKKMQQLINIEEQKSKCRVLNMDYFNRLPEDILIHIHGYLMPETRIEIIKSRYPNLHTNLMKLKVPQIKQLLESIRINHYTPVLHNLYKKNRARCLPKGFYMRFGFQNKQTAIYTIIKLLGSYEAAIAHTQGDYRYFQNKSLQILKTMIYVAKKKRVLDSPYAPELEKPINPLPITIKKKTKTTKKQ